MQADVPLDEQQPVTADATDAWDRWYWLWDVYLTICFAGTITLVLANDEAATPKIISVVAVVGIAVAYLALGRALVGAKRLNGVTRAEMAFVFLIMVLFVTSALAKPQSSFILFAVCPLVYMSLPVRPAAVLTTLAILLAPASTYLRFGFDNARLGTLLPVTVLLIVFGLLVGYWVSRIIEQSKERAALIEQLEASQAEVVRLSGETATAAERERLAREIHDTLAQGFTSIVALTQAIESELDTDLTAARRHLDLARRTARENLAEARAMVAASAPTPLATGSLEEAIRRQAERLAEEASLAVSCEVTDSLPSLGTATEVVLLRATQEALTNIRKHSDATTASIALSVVHGWVRLRVSDDGVGFDPDKPAEGFGLRGMRARAEQVGGSVKVHSGQTRGTIIELEVPA